MSLLKKIRPAKIFAFLALATGLVSLSFYALPSQAADVVEPDNSGVITIGEAKTNLIVAGSEVTINENVSKDLVTAGGNIKVNTNVERSANIAGGQIDINSESIGVNANIAGGEININTQNIGANARITGGTVEMNGATIEEDLFIAAGSTSLIDTTVKGNVYLGTGDLFLEGVTIEGDIEGGYETLAENSQTLDDSVQGAVNITQSEPREDEDKSGNNFGRIFWPAQIGLLVGLVILLVWMKRFGVEKFKRMTFSAKDLGMQFLIGISTLILVPIVFIITAFLGLFTLTGSITALIYIYYGLMAIFVPVYLAHIAKDLFKLKTSILTLSLIVFVTFLATHLISSAHLPFVSGLFWIFDLIWCACQSISSILSKQLLT